MSFLEYIQEAYSALHGMLYAQVVEPILFAMGKMAWAEDVFDGTEWFLLGCIQLLIISVIFRTWERFWPAEQQAKTDPSIRTDLLYTLIDSDSFMEYFSYSLPESFFRSHPSCTIFVLSD